MPAFRHAIGHGTLGRHAAWRGRHPHRNPRPATELPEVDPTPNTTGYSAEPQTQAKTSRLLENRPAALADGTG
ncbi:hypothetical protein [Actinomadura sp. NBRC 104425]|uniref:hypothetical protein n=1 Tax=Actinomadura sp. NBRC 104425 TaxID=3032204 RepID=UPI0025558B24|nr:hypothetical protein [Actinomadura sp. NBRC 104425]